MTVAALDVVVAASRVGEITVLAGAVEQVAGVSAGGGSDAERKQSYEYSRLTITM